MDVVSDQFVLRGGHVIDAEQGIDRVTDVHVAGTRIEFVGTRDIAPQAKVIDVSGQYVSPGWIDIHVHAYGTLGFANPDSVGNRNVASESPNTPCGNSISRTA